MRTTIAVIASSLLASSAAFPQENPSLSLADISARHPAVRMSDAERPCEVLAMLEAAHDALQTSNAPSSRD